MTRRIYLSCVDYMIYSIYFKLNEIHIVYNGVVLLHIMVFYGRRGHPYDDLSSKGHSNCIKYNY